mmetsp:Transcript_1233/g.1797  ORF Transcript_1233/g.1797 Transcript_1233/m.1797 type:complete len:316 (-) Transcript_1233:737-1684(-)|eukprot:CAMPEP_0118704932 /NCGR_PEP_ID=MMETSP0800-20121206/19561_1 /TAXON_ID=210618 ORGANISM="Striatella unipunctata, Strain CCMP2910" /NCGR_SAMPLE_ID=MMETSP0800 /ASSEMBLY_ACC=CAM_ASM_000638 /LENGTH=315 /DNA_ID=CAMNT_0006606979 /DNA_START=82 /DNA_END=1029 /DNA_ORIENTATION=+
MPPQETTNTDTVFQNDQLVKPAEEERKMPAVLKPLLFVYYSVPKIYIPGTQTDISFTIASFFWLAGARMSIEATMVAFGWPDGHEWTKSAAACLTGAIFHSTPLTFYLGCCLYFTKLKPSEKLSSEVQWWQDCAVALLQFCTGYMIYDATFSIILLRQSLGQEWKEDDYIFMAHHLITSSYMSSNRVVGAGYVSAMMCMFIGEITNPVHNTFYATRYAVKLFDTPWVHDMHSIVEYSFALSYFFMRAVVSPFAGTYIVSDLLFNKKGQQAIPFFLRAIWVFLIVAILYGSIPLVQECYEMFSDGLVVKYGPDSEF